jgi:hypothetical protein
MVPERVQKPVARILAIVRVSVISFSYMHAQWGPAWLDLRSPRLTYGRCGGVVCRLCLLRVVLSVISFSRMHAQCGPAWLDLRSPRLTFGRCGGVVCRLCLLRVVLW